MADWVLAHYMLDNQVAHYSVLIHAGRHWMDCYLLEWVQPTCCANTRVIPV